MKKIRVIKKRDCAGIGVSFESERASMKPSQRELVEVVGDWVADWRKRSEMETRQALNECARFRVGSFLEM